VVHLLFITRIPYKTYVREDQLFLAVSCFSVTLFYSTLLALTHRQKNGRRNTLILVGLSTLTGSSKFILVGLATLTGSSRLNYIYGQCRYRLFDRPTSVSFFCNHAIFVQIYIYAYKYASCSYIMDAYEYASRSYIMDAYEYASCSYIMMSTHCSHIVLWGIKLPPQFVRNISNQIVTHHYRSHRKGDSN
jgi:hypothetical protein